MFSFQKVKLMLLVAGLGPRRAGFDLGALHVRCVDEVTQGKVFLRVPRPSSVSHIPPLRH
jgi:hypothetical protein